VVYSAAPRFEERQPLHDRTLVKALPLAALPPILCLTGSGFVADRLLGTFPLGVALGVGAGGLLAAFAVTRLTLAQLVRVSPEDTEDPAE
jgi:hypothetical protein